jgi:hypothetical protein
MSLHVIPFFHTTFEASVSVVDDVVVGKVKGRRTSKKKKTSRFPIQRKVSVIIYIRMNVYVSYRRYDNFFSSSFSIRFHY